MMGGCGADGEVGSLGFLASLKHLHEEHTLTRKASSTRPQLSGEPILVPSHSIELTRTSKRLWTPKLSCLGRAQP